MNRELRAAIAFALAVLGVLCVIGVYHHFEHYGTATCHFVGDTPTDCP